MPPIVLGPVATVFPDATVRVADLPELADLPQARRTHALSLGVQTVRCAGSAPDQPGDEWEHYAAPLWEPSTIATVARAFDTAVRDLCAELAPGSPQDTPDTVLTGRR